MANEHSPGPWRAVRFYQKHCERIPDHWCWGVEDGEGSGYLAVLPEDVRERTEADARLIAAAPEAVELVGLVLTALERSSPAEPGYGEIQWRQDVMAQGKAWLERVRDHP